MDAVADIASGVSDVLRDTVQVAQNALARAVAQANLAGDPLGPALDAMSVSLGAQLALHEANTGHFRQVSERLDGSVADAVLRGGQMLETRRIVVVESLATELVKLAEQNAQIRNAGQSGGLVSLRMAITYGGCSVVLLLGVGLAAYAAGWQAGRGAAGPLASALHQAGPDAEAALVGMVRVNNVGQAWAVCQKTAMPDQTGRRVCTMPMWADPQTQPPPPR